MSARLLNLMLWAFVISIAGNAQVSIAEVGKNYIEIQMLNKTELPKQLINPYFLGLSKGKDAQQTFYLFDSKYRFRCDTLFLYLNDTAILPGIEKYNLGDSLRLDEGVNKFDTLFPHEEIKIRYHFAKRPFSILVVYYSFSDVSYNSRRSELLFYKRKRNRQE